MVATLRFPELAAMLPPPRPVVDNDHTRGPADPLAVFAELLDHERSQPWRAYAACHGADTAAFFADARAGRGVADAIAICERCPVQAECLAWARAQGRGLVGVLGGETWAQRHDRRHRRRSSAA